MDVKGPFDNAVGERPGKHRAPSTGPCRSEGSRKAHRKPVGAAPAGSGDAVVDDQKSGSESGSMGEAQQDGVQ